MHIYTGGGGGGGGGGGDFKYVQKIPHKIEKHFW